MIMQLIEIQDNVHRLSVS